MIVPIVLTAFGLGIAALITAFYIKKSKEKPTEPTEPEQPKEPKKPDEPDDQDDQDVPKKPEEPKTPPTPDNKPENKPEQEPEQEPEQKPDKFVEIIEYYKDVAMLEDWSKTYDYIKKIYKKYLTLDLRKKELFPYILDYYGEEDNEYAKDQELAWLVGMILAEILPEKRDEIYKKAYDYCIKGTDQPTYSYTFDTDPNVSRLVASAAWAVTRKPLKIRFLREEQESNTIKYNKEIDELFVNIKEFMPHAPGPYLNSDRDKPLNVDSSIEYNLKEDKEIHDYISKYYNLDTKDAEKRQATIQAIADKESAVQHLFGGDRTVVDPDYGEMTLKPVFGKHNIGIEIPTDGAIANLVDTLGVHCSRNRNSLLKQEYGRRRPGMGKTDASRNSDPNQRALVNYAIEEGDGFTTGYYNKDGDYIDSTDGQHIGDFVKYFQKEMWSNSYPSGHSAFIWGVALLLMEVMPDRAEQIMKAANQFAINRTVARYHWNSDTIHGRVIGSIFVPIMHSIDNLDTEKLVDEAKKEYKQLIS